MTDTMYGPNRETLREDYQNYTLRVAAHMTYIVDDIDYYRDVDGEECDKGATPFYGEQGIAREVVKMVEAGMKDTRTLKAVRTAYLGF